MSKTQTTLRDLVEAMSHWWGKIHLRNLNAAEQELTRMRELAQGLSDHPRIAAVQAKHQRHGTMPHENALDCGIDFIAAVTDALKPGCYRSRSTRH